MAKKFVFELQDVLDFRNFEKEQAENELAKALAVETQINNDLQTIASQYLFLKSEMNKTSNFEDVIVNNQHKSLLNYQKEELLKQLAEAKLVSEEKRKVLTEVMKKTTALEKLKEKEQEAYKEALDYEESNFVDDLANSKAKY